MIVRAWAVICKSGEVHQDDEQSCLFLDRDQARDTKTGHAYEPGVDDLHCGPHKVIALSGEVTIR